MADRQDAPEPVPRGPTHGPAAAGADPSFARPADDPLKLEKKRSRMRAAWIAFVGRILAQMIGAIATVVLGMYVVRTYGVDRAPRQGGPETSAASTVTPPAPHARLSLVVLPFTWFSSSSRNAYLGEGLTEALIADLARTSGLRVVSRTSSMSYKGTTKTLPTIARELDVGFVVEGAVAREGDHVRVTVQLIDAASDTHLWSRTYDRTANDLLALQAEVTPAIARGLRVAVRPRQEQAAALQAGVGATTFDTFARARQAVTRRSPTDLRAAAALLDDVIARAPGFAPAHATRAGMWCLRALDTIDGHAAREAFDRAETSAVEALRLDSDNADAHLALAVVRHRRDWDWAAAEREFARVLELDQDHGLAHQWYAIFLAEQRRHAPAQQQAALALDVAADSAPAHRTAGLVALYARRLGDAEGLLRRSLALDPAAGDTRLLLASVLLQRGRVAEARAMADLVRDVALADQRLSLLASAAARTGDRTSARRYQDEARALPGPRSIVADAGFAAALGDAPALLATAARAVAARADLACALEVHPAFEQVRRRPDFEGLVRQVGL